MKKHIKGSAIGVVILLFFVSKINAQQVPLVSQYFYSPMLYNPAMAGTNQEVNIWLMDREQWVGVKGAPSTRGGTVDAGFLKNRIGVGLAIFQDKTDIINRILGQVTIAGRVKLFKDAHISLGLTPSIMDARIDFQKANPEVLADPHLFQQVQSRTTFDLNAGLAFTWRKLIVGFAVPQILNSRAKYLSALNATDLTMTRHYITHASYKFMLAKDRFFIQPMFLMKYTKNAPIQPEGNLIFGYKNIVWAGAGYRYGNGIMAMAGVNISNMVTIGYAFDYHLNSKVMKPLGSSHEVVLGVRIPYGKQASAEEKGLQESIAKLKAMDEQQLAQKAMLDSLQLALGKQDSKLNAANTKINALQAELDAYKKKLEDMHGQFESASKLYEQNAKPKDVFSNLESTANGNIYRLDGVYFDKNSSVLTAASNDQLNNIVKVLNEKPTMRIKVLGHTDSAASDEYNLWLSSKRASAVASYIISKGIASSRIAVQGYGKSLPIATNDTEEGRSKNRRVEIEILQQ